MTCIGVLAAACGPSGIDGLDAPASYASSDAGATRPAQTQGTCAAAPPKPLDPSTLPACCGGGKAHCVPSADVPASLASQLDSCPGGACVPDTFITNPAAKPSSCKSLNGAAGACMSTCVPQVRQVQDALPQDTCATDERCAPCVSPLDGKETGACSLGQAPATCADGGAPSGGGTADAGSGTGAPVLASCCSLGGTPRGTCVPQGAVPANDVSRLGSDTCAVQQLCVPTEMIDPKFVPARCSVLAPLPGAPSVQGVCLSRCLQFSKLEQAVLTQGSCDAVHVCVPCTDPLGHPTGAPGC